MNVLSYLEKRQLGYAGFRKNVYDLVIERIGCLPRKNDGVHNINYDIGNTFVCKFSKNKNNLHVVGCSTELGEIVVENTFSNDNTLKGQFQKSKIHNNAIFNFAWAEPQMKLVTACADKTSKLCSLTPSGKLVEEKQLHHYSPVRSVMFCPESSNVYCGGCQDGSIKIWDVRINNCYSVLDCNIPYAHGKYCCSRPLTKTREYGISSLIFKNDLTVISCSSMDTVIKVWDLRKSYRQVTMFTEPLPLMKYFHPLNDAPRNIGFTDIIMNPQSTHLYGSGVDNVIYCYALDSSERSPICQYSGFIHETSYSKISISNDGRYLFSGCVNRAGVLWLTDFPHIEKPVYEIKNCSNGFKRELSASDWCADPTCMKMVTSADSLPMVWSVLTDEQKKGVNLKISRTPLCKSKLYFKNYCTAPIKFDDELKEKCKEETEKNMENWDTHHQDLVSNVDHTQVTPKKPWDILFMKAKSSASSKTSSKFDSKSSSNIPNQIPKTVTPNSNKKRKKSIISPRSLIDQYLVPTNKREKLDTDTEI